MIKEAAVKYGVAKKKYEKRSTYCKVSKTCFENLEKKTSLFFENSGEISCNMSYALLKTWSILRMLKVTENWQFFDFLDFFISFQLKNNISP